MNTLSFLAVFAFSAFAAGATTSERTAAFVNGTCSGTPLDASGGLLAIPIYLYSGQTSEDSDVSSYASYFFQVEKHISFSMFPITKNTFSFELECYCADSPTEVCETYKSSDKTSADVVSAVVDFKDQDQVHCCAVKVYTYYASGAGLACGELVAAQSDEYLTYWKAATQCPVKKGNSTENVVGKLPVPSSFQGVVYPSESGSCDFGSSNTVVDLSSSSSDSWIENFLSDADQSTTVYVESSGNLTVGLSAVEGTFKLTRVCAMSYPDDTLRALSSSLSGSKISDSRSSSGLCCKLTIEKLSDSACGIIGAFPTDVLGSLPVSGIDCSASSGNGGNSTDPNAALRPAVWSVLALVMLFLASMFVI